MKPSVYLILSGLLLPGISLGEKEPVVPSPPSERGEKFLREDVPILPVTRGDVWTYNVHLEIPADVTSSGAAAVNTKHSRTRTYLGKVAAAEGLPETDCFEVVVPGSPTEREFVDIYEDRILMRGSLIMRQETTSPMWLKTPVPFVIAGMKPGSAFPELNVGGSLTRKTQLIAREDVTVPAGTFRCLKLLTTGTDGDIELRRTVWFAAGKGIIREETTRYRRDKLLYRETQELQELRRAPNKD